MNSTDFNIIPKSDELDFLAMGNLILNRSISLSIAVNNELLSPISQWLDDPGFMEKFAINLEQDTPNWARYKKKQRQWTAQKKALASERLRLYWQEIRKRKNLRKELSKLFCRAGSRASPEISFDNLDNDCIAEIVKPFSPPEQAKRETKRQFIEARSRPPSNLFPWKTILQNDIQESRSFDQLKQYHHNPKIDKAAKLIHLLQMETDGLVTLNQQKPFGDIQMDLNMSSSSPEGSFTIKDRQGNNYEFRWPELSDDQRKKLIADTLKGKILCTA